MNFISYIERQKSIIRGRHYGEETVVYGKITKDRTEKIFEDLNGMKGLNTAERAGSRKKCTV